MSTLLCTGCNTEKEVTKDNFYFRKWSDTVTKPTQPCKECFSEYNRQRYLDKVRYQLLEEKYGITKSQYIAKFTEQGGVCAICHHPPDSDKLLDVDHCHRTNKLRGLLCRKCNQGVGYFNDDIELLERVIEYLEIYK